MKIPLRKSMHYNMTIIMMIS